MRARFFYAVLLLVLATSCKHEIDSYTTEPLSDYLPLSIGKYSIYQLDSTVFTNFGRVLEVHHYQEKQEVAAQLTDNLNRPTYRINRYLRDSAGTEGWQTAGTFFITPSEKTVEVLENNQRTVRLAAPIKEGFSWKGNSYLPDDAYQPTYDFSNDNSMSLWDYTYGAQSSEVYNGTTIPDVLPVYHVDDAENVQNDFQVEVDTAYGSRSFSMDKYAKGIGLVYQELILWDHQANLSIDASTTPPTRTFSPYYQGFGVKRTLLAHN